MKELLIDSASGAMALTKDRRLVEYWEDMEAPPYAAGAIYLGRAGRVMKALGALFVSLAPGVEGFLPFSEMRDHGLRPGDSLLVQVKRPPQGKKSAYLTQDIALTGRYAMLLPRGDYAHASKRAASRQAMKRLAQRLRPADMGMVLRAKAEDVEEAVLRAEIARLQADWAQLQEKSRHTQAPALLAPAPDALTRLLQDEAELPCRVIAHSEAAARGLDIPLVLHPEPFSLYSIKKQLYEALKRRVYLPSGGSLVLDPTEAALVIDVNTSQDAKKGGDLHLRTNLEAAKEIARLLRLRRAGGMILIDFIDMDTEEQRSVVSSALQEALKEDRVPSEVLGFTRLGLMEMTRKRMDSPLPAQRLEPPQEEENTPDA